MKYFIMSLFMVLAVTCSGGYAKPLYIEITGGHNIGIPIAVVPFSEQQHFSMRGEHIAELGNIVRNDLHNSGQFRALDFREFAQHPHDISEVNFKYWKQKGIEGLVIGKLRKSPDSKYETTYDVTFHLIDVFKNHTIPLLSMNFKNQRPENLRALAHHISDLVFEKMTGVKGFFTTRIGYITVDHYQDKTVHTLTIADADGYNDKPLVSATYPLMSPVWSPRGDKIAYVSFRGNRSAIKIVNVISGQIAHVSSSPGINGAPAWSPDGKSLALVLSKDGSPKIYIMNLATRKLTRVTHGGSIDTEPAWFPDGKAIGFTSNRGGKPQIYRVTLATGKVQRLTFEGSYNATPSITPDGKKLVMLHKSKEGLFNIAVQDLETGKVRVLTKARLDESPSLAPNGMMVLYGTREADRNILGAVTLDGRFKMRLPVQDGNVKEPAWSPFLL